MGLTKFLGRAAFGGFFLYNGIKHFQEAGSLQQYAAAKRIPNPDFAVKASGALLVASGLSLVLGIKPRLGAVGVASFLAAITPAMHDFWKQTDPGQKQNEMIHFSKNMALLAAALAIHGNEQENESCSSECA